MVSAGCPRQRRLRLPILIVFHLENLGPTPAFVATWPAAWAVSWLVAFPTLLALLPLVRKIVALAVEAPSSS
jgi:hypothetical protein